MRANTRMQRMERRGETGGARERGSALLISLMVMVILTLLGIAYLLMAETENQIAANQRNSSQALYTAESGARLVVDWFNRPLTAFLPPMDLGTTPPGQALADADRTLRMIDTDEDGDHDTLYSAVPKPEYKETTDLLFQKPYRGSDEDAFLGSEDGPDIRITSGTFLDALNAALQGTAAGTPADPSPDATFGRITQIDVYSPPILELTPGIRTRYGVATIKVTAQKVRTIGGADRVIAERSVKAVVNEINYPAADGPLSSCGELNWDNAFVVRWGKASATTVSDFGINNNAIFTSRIRKGMPYGSGSPSNYFADVTDFNTWYADANGETIVDPWTKILSGGTITDIGLADAYCTAPGTQQPCPRTAGPVTWDADEYSNIFQDQSGLAGCPNFDYGLFKTVAQRGGSGIFYYTWDSAASKFREAGSGAPKTFVEVTNGKPGFFFFDTTDSGPPNWGEDGYMDDGDPISCDNCAPGLDINSSTGWGTGPDVFMYLNVDYFRTTGAGSMGYTRTFNAPGEPYFDTDGDGAYDGTEPHVELTYSTTNADAGFVVGAGGTRDDTGPDIPNVSDVILHGIMYLSGTFDAGANGKYYGAMIAHHIDVGSTVDMWFNEKIIKNAWPPADSPVPKVYVTLWEVENL